MRTYPFKVGDFQCTVIQAQDQQRTLEQLKGMFHNVPEEQVQAEMGKYGDNVPFSINLLLIQTPQGNFLVDTSVGGDTALLDTLRELGVPPESINRVILTHEHGDHIGGLVTPDGELAFPNARYSMWKTEWENAYAKAEQNTDPKHPLRHLLAIRDKVDLIDHESEIAPGICAIPAPGHTLGHMGLLIESRGERLLHIVDAAHHPAQITYGDWSPRFDSQPDISATTRKALAERAARENLLVQVYHFAFPGQGHVIQQGDTLVWQPIAQNAG